jgi:ribosomal protein S18 acetylase RimI-like enzyme
MRCAFCESWAWYRCAETGRLVCPRHARFQVVAQQTGGEPSECRACPAAAEHYPRLADLALRFWGETSVESFGRAYDVLHLPAFVNLEAEEVVGFLSYAVEDGCMNLVMLNVVPGHQGRGLAKSLLGAAVAEAQKLGLGSLVVAASNDDLPALDFYQRAGFVITEVVPGLLVEHHGGVEEGFAGIAVRDEIRMRLSLDGENLGG